MNEFDYGYVEDDGSELNAQEMLEQERWEKENSVDLLDNDPDYHRWADDLNILAERDREIIDLAEIETERHNSGLTIEAWDRNPRLGSQ